MVSLVFTSHCILMTYPLCKFIFRHQTFFVDVVPHCGLYTLFFEKNSSCHFLHLVYNIYIASCKIMSTMMIRARNSQNHEWWIISKRMACKTFSARAL